jgi:murein DD-endopeptidase MepM/ murein hydrolase activator NlpD
MRLPCHQRLRRLPPETFLVLNTINDATSGHRHQRPAGHEGIDFASDAGTDVKAM